VKPVILVAVLLFSQFLFASTHTPLTKDRELQVLYSELKFVESESLRVVFTIETLEERLHQPLLLQDPEDLFLQLGSLYRYYAKLDAYQRELNEIWNQLLGTDDGASVAFTSDQLKPIRIISNKYLDGLPKDAIPISGLPLSNY
jgi:hypothetical protein